LGSSKSDAPSELSTALWDLDLADTDDERVLFFTGDESNEPDDDGSKSG
jgi:hypothetical protein